MALRVATLRLSIVSFRTGIREASLWMEEGRVVGPLSASEWGDLEEVWDESLVLLVVGSV